MPWSRSPRVVALRSRFRTVDVIVETLDGWRCHQTGRTASLLSFWGFLSIFPLMLVATTVVGLVLEGNEDLQRDIIDGALADIPVLGAELAADPGPSPALRVGLMPPADSGGPAPAVPPTHGGAVPSASTGAGACGGHQNTIGWRATTGHWRCDFR